MSSMSRFFLHPLLRLLRNASAIALAVLRRLGQFQPHQPLARGKVRSPHPQGSSDVLQYTSTSRPTRFRRFSKMVWLGLALVLLSHIGLTWLIPSPVDAANPGTRIELPLSTQGAKIVDARGRSVFLRGVNWFGIETEMHAPHGLWKRDYKEMLEQIKTLGYNVIRLPYSVQSLRASEVTGIDYSIGSNQELQDKSPLEVMDAIIQEAERQGLLILLDSHRLNDQRIPELWYGDGFTEEDWISTWTLLATRYRNQKNIIGADLKNEPHGKASWGTNDRTTDWRLAAERCGNAILAINPNWLIVVEGVENNVPGQKLKIHWMGANLEGVKRFPVRLSRSNKLVYSPHEYGPGVFNQPWFSEARFPNNLSSRWETGWHYIATQRIAPIFIGEFGGRQVDADSKEGIWQRKLVDFIRQKNLSFAYWSWNPNSDDTGGILLDDWLSVDAPKQELLQGLLVATSFSGSGSATPSISSTPRPQPSSNPTITRPTPQSQPRVSVPTTSQSQLRVTSNIQSDWQDGFCMTMQVTNPGNSSVQDWQLTFQMNQAAINNSWNGNFVKSQGSKYVVTPPDWGRVIEPGQSRELGFCANKLGSDYQPRQVSAATISSKSSSQLNPSVYTTAQNSKATQAQLRVTSNMQSDWQDGFCISMQVTNLGNSTVRDWQVKFRMNQAAINNSWNGTFQPQGSQYVVTPLDWGRAIEPGQSQELGFCANKLGSDYQPQQLSVF
ncbi:MAG: cellulase family glycosylhydrolase [Coleofasciculus sp. S288]|nr:cellulase family glycosylhydrolase [Coleofasciculus sp. S288]